MCPCPFPFCFRGEEESPQSFDYRRYSWNQPKPAITQQSLSSASMPHLHQLAWRVIFYMLFWSNSDMLQRQQNAAKKLLMKENKTWLMLSNGNQKNCRSSRTQWCHGSPKGLPQLELRKHLRCTEGEKPSTHPARVRTMRSGRSSCRWKMDWHDEAASLTQSIKARISLGADCFSLTWKSDPGDGGAWIHERGCKSQLFFPNVQLCALM